MENNVHHDVYNADVCTRATKSGGGRGTQRAKKEKKIGMGQRGGASRVATRRKKRIEEESTANDKRKKDDDKRGEGREGDRPMKEKVEEEEEEG